MKIVSVCQNGLGTSLIMKMNLEKVCQELQLSAQIQHMSLASAADAQAELWVTSREIGEKLKKMKKEPIMILENLVDRKTMKEFLTHYLKETTP